MLSVVWCLSLFLVCRLSLGVVCWSLFVVLVSAGDNCLLFFVVRCLLFVEFAGSRRRASFVVRCLLFVVVNGCACFVLDVRHWLLSVVCWLLLLSLLLLRICCLFVVRCVPCVVLSLLLFVV